MFLISFCKNVGHPNHQKLVLDSRKSTKIMSITFFMFAIANIFVLVDLIYYKKLENLV